MPRDCIDVDEAEGYRDILVPTSGKRQLSNLTYREIGHMLAEEDNRRDRHCNIIPYRGESVALAIWRKNRG